MRTSRTSQGTPGARSNDVRCIRFHQDEPTSEGLIGTLVRALALGGASLPLVELRQATTRWISELVERGQQLGAVGTDLPQELLVGPGVALSEGIDLWLVDSLDELGAEMLETLVTPLAGLFRRIAKQREPRGAHA